jgi:hypothetical protein
MNFGILIHNLRTLRHDFMRTRFEFRHILAPCANGYPKCYSHKDQTYPFAHQNLVKSLKPLVVVCVCDSLL